MPADLLYEIGTEEIPAAFLAKALQDLQRLATERLGAARLDAAGVTALGTPRRLTLLVSDLADRQSDLEERLVGPPAKIAFDAEGRPTKAAIGFAKRNGVEVEALEREELDDPKSKKKGEYVVCTRRLEGAPAREVLPALLAELTRALPWPKAMRWAGGEESFVRPVHWVVALLGADVLPLSIVGVEAGRETRGHRFLAPASFAVESGRQSYVSALRKAFVIVEPEARRSSIVAELARIEGETGARVREDQALLDEVVNLVEYPVAVCGEFDPAFLEVPEEVIVSAMRSHQRYFAMEDGDGKLANRFVTVAGTVTRDLEVVRHGNERVLAARLADARFFFREDLKVSLDDRARELEHVVFQSKLGTVAAKAARIGAIAEWLGALVGADTAAAARAAALCKADLVTNMVGEFPDLQGTMGQHYARAASESEAVCLAISEHYLPRGAGDVLPTTDLGAVVGLADRIDTVVGCFAVGLAPSGSADPYGLRRAALGILAILLDRGWSVSLRALIATAAERLGVAEVDVPEALRVEIATFFRTRLKGVLVDVHGLPADCVEAALNAGFDDVPDARARAEAVARLRTREDFEPLASGFKRVANILKGEAADGDPDSDRFAESEERALWDAFCVARNRVEALLGEGDYHGALQVLSELKGPVDQFFDAVLVMDKDESVRNNRLALLGRINATFTRIADFRQLTV